MTRLMVHVLLGLPGCCLAMAAAGVDLSWWRVLLFGVGLGIYHIGQTLADEMNNL